MKIVKLLFWLWKKVRLPNWLRWALVSAANQKFLVGAAVVILNEQHEVLLFNHTYRLSYPWGLPTGWLQRGESPARAIEREVFEESQLVVHVTGLLSVSAAQDVPRLDIVYAGCPVGGSFRPSAEVSTAAFFAPANLPPILADQRAMIAQALEQVGQSQNQVNLSVSLPL